ncbi:MAG: zinc ribbon domain-containing protein [Chloroflexi bacterium]|nr:zinc ribbon domain-containing protein [Chloroflexota bacterium]
MNKTLQWTIGISVILIVLAIVFSTVAPYIFPSAWGDYGYGMMGGRGMMGGYGGFGFMPFGGFMFLGPILFIGLIVLGVVWLVRALTPLQPVAFTTCTHCGKTLQPNWKACPHCGEKV